MNPNENKSKPSGENPGHYATRVSMGFSTDSLGLMSVANEVKRSEAAIQWLDRRLDGLEVKGDDRTRLAASLLDMAHEHHKAIVLLVAHKLVGSAFALVRLLFEAYIRGVWLHRCATERQVEQFKKEKPGRAFADLVKDIEQLPGFESGVLSQAQFKSWKAMNSFTHGGFAQAVRRITAQTIEANYSEDETVEVLKFAYAIGFLAAIASCDLAGNVVVASEVLERARKDT